MALETDLQAMGRHLVDVFNTERLTMVAEGTNLPAFAKADYGEPRAITQWPFLSVQPQMKIRELKATRKWGIEFVIWVIIYHGVGGDPRKYSLGIALLDSKDPTQVIYRQEEPILEPELDWEVNGFVPNVVFSCGQVIVGDQLFVYYAGADTAIGVATVPISEIESYGA